MSIFNYVNWFFMYSFLGYLLECIVLTIEYKKPVVDRGFGHGPFCIIYGFGAVGACLLLSPLSDHPVEYSIYDYGNYHGADHSQCDDPPVWKLLVGLQPQAI